MATLYIDNTNKTGDLTGADWTFTNGSTAVASAGNGDAVNNGLVAGDYIRANGGTQWYKVATVTDGDNLVITPAFQQATIAGTATINWQDVSVKDGTSIANAWCHPALYTTDTVRTAGDIGKMRANQTHVMAGIHLIADEDGTGIAPIQLIGCNSVDDPWSDASDVDPKIDFSSTVFKLSWSTDFFWWFDNIEFTGSTGTVLTMGNVPGLKCKNLNVHDNFGGLQTWASISGSNPYPGDAEVEDCIFADNTNQFTIATDLKIKSTTINGGTTGFAIEVGNIELEDVLIGQTTPLTKDFYMGNGNIKARRSKFDFDKVSFYAASYSVEVASEDHNQVIGDHKRKSTPVFIERETTEVRGGGATSSIKVTPTTFCNTNYPKIVMEWEEQAVPASAQTRGVAIKQGLADPTGFPTNVQLWLEAEYYNHATNDTVTTAVSTATISVYDTWTWFPVTYTPAQVQKVRYRVWLGVKKSAEAYYIDNQLYDANTI